MPLFRNTCVFRMTRRLNDEISMHKALLKKKVQSLLKMDLLVDISFLIFLSPPKMETSKSCSKYCSFLFGFLKALHSAVSCLILRLKLLFNNQWILLPGHRVLWCKNDTALIPHPDTAISLNFELIYKGTVTISMLKFCYDSDTYSQFKVLNTDLLSL